MTEKPFRVIIAGSRDFNDYELLKRVADYLLQNKDQVVIVSGAARGADLLGERYAKERGLEIARYEANWDLYGKRAGYLRNEEMARNADALIAFWDGRSRGTKHMIEIACNEELQVKTVMYKEKMYGGTL